jgi:hypothetical protein
MAALAPMAVSLLASQAPTIARLGQQAAMAIGGKGVSDIIGGFKSALTSQSGRESLLRGAGKGIGLGSSAAKEVLGGLHSLNILGNRSYGRLTGGIDRFAGGAQRAMGKLFKINKKLKFW